VEQSRFLDELFKTESKSKVYGCIHGFVFSNPATTTGISKSSSCIMHCVVIVASPNPLLSIKQYSKAAPNATKILYPEKYQ